jgi:2-polyprenyl-6-methoxyphenol hydroxylase-like FAD-dependent oxidoreductase
MSPPLPSRISEINVSLAGLEDVLREREEKLGVAIRLGTPVIDFEQNADGVGVHANGEVIRTRWLVGCDGGRSTVRQRAGIAFEESAPELTGTIAVADFDDPEKLKPGWNITAKDMYVNGPSPGRIGVVCWTRTRQNGIPREPGRLSGRVRRCRFCGPSHMGARRRRLCAT